MQPTHGPNPNSRRRNNSNDNESNDISTAKRILPRRQPPPKSTERTKEGRLKFKSRLHPHRHARSDHPSPIVHRRHHCVRHGPLARDARAHRVTSPTSTPNTKMHAPNVKNSVERSSNNNALAIGRGRTLHPLP